MKNSERLLKEIADKDLQNLIKENEKYINSFHASIYPEGLLSCIESDSEKSGMRIYNKRINAFYKIYPDH